MWSRRSFLTIPAGTTLCGQANDRQFTSEAAMVLTPATVIDRGGKFVRGISAEHFVLFDSGDRQRVIVEEDPQPLSLILALHASFDARKPLHRLRKVASLFGPLVIGANGTAGLVAFRDDVETVVPLTSEFDKVTRAVRALVAKDWGCALVDAIHSSAEILRAGAAGRRKVIVIVTEDRDRSSKADLRETLINLQRNNITVYALTYSPGLMQLGREVPTGP